MPNVPPDGQHPITADAAGGALEKAAASYLVNDGAYQLEPSLADHGISNSRRATWPTIMPGHFKAPIQRHVWHHSAPSSHLSMRSILMLTADRQIDRRILNAATSLRSDGWQVDIIAAPSEDTGHDDIHTKRVNTREMANRSGLIWRAYLKMSSLLESHSRVLEHIRRFAWRFLADERTFHEKLFWPSVQNLQATVIVANDLPMLSVGHRLARRCGARLVYDSHELWCEQMLHPRQKRRWTAIEAALINECDLVTTVNHSIAAELKKRYGLSTIEVIHNAVPANPLPVPSISWQTKFGLPANASILLFQGGLIPGRNLENLVVSIELLRHSPVHLVLLGSGQLESGLRRLARAKHLEDRVHFHPAVPQDALPGMTAAADIGVIPYLPDCLNNYYCTPNKLFEFIAAGVPIIGSDLPELRRFIADRDIGLVADLSTPARIAAAVTEAVGDEQRMDRWREHLSTQRVELGWEVESEKLRHAFDSLK